MRKTLAILAFASSLALAGSMAPPVELSGEQIAALERAVNSVNAGDLGIMSIYARREYGMENLVANVESGPYDVQGSGFSAYWLFCEEKLPTEWQCRNSRSEQYVYYDSTIQSVVLHDDVSLSVATAILADVLDHCDVHFDVPLYSRPQLSLDSRTGTYKFWGSKCNYEYDLIHGQPILGAPYRLDTEYQEIDRLCDISRLGNYMVEVSNKLHSNWTIPAEGTDIICSVAINQDNNGEITSYEFSQCDYDIDIRNSIEKAIVETAVLPLDSAGICFFETVRLEFLHYAELQQ